MAKLTRKLSLTSIIAISIAGMLGSGIFVLPGIAAAKTGSSIWLAYLCAAISIVPAVLSKAELATAMPKSGGAYVYIERAFGPLFGTISGLGLWFSLLLKSSFALIGFGAYLMIILGTESIKIEYVSLLFLILIMILNILGVKKVGKVQIYIVSISLLGLISIITISIPELNKQPINEFLTHGNSGLFSTIAFVYLSYAGVTKIAAIAGEVKNPSRNLPLAMIISLIVISTIYVSIAYILSKNLSLDELQYDYKPIHTLSTLLGGEWFAYIISIIGILTLISMANSGILASSRFPFAMAVDKLLPKTFTTIHKKYLTPINTIILTCIIMSIVILFLDVAKIAKLASAFKVLMFISINLCVIILRETAVQWYQPKYKSPFYPYIQLFGILSGIFLLFYLGIMPMIAILTVGILGTAIYFLFGKKASRSGVLINYGHIPALFFFFKKEYDFKKSRAFKMKEDKDYKIDHQDVNSTIITLLGNERSPEILCEIGHSINIQNKVEVISITEVPDQTSLDAIELSNPETKSIQRQIKYLAKRHNTNFNFQSLVTHNVSETIQDLTLSDQLKWFVLEWNGRAYNGILINNPLGWIVSNINSNFALFKDNGIKYFNKILLTVRPNSKDLKKLIKVTSNISKFHDTKFDILQIATYESSDDYIKELEVKLSKTIDKNPYINKVLIKKHENAMDYITNITPDYDLLILGTPKKDTLKKMLFGTGKDQLALQSKCSVLRLTIKSN